MDHKLILAELEKWPEIGEENFRLNYLEPLLSGTEAGYKKWLTVCIKPTLPVNVVDSEGKVVVTVPAVRTKRALNVGSSQLSLAKSIAKDLEAKVPKSGDRIMNPIVKRLFGEKEMDGKLEKWLEIIERYGSDDLKERYGVSAISTKANGDSQSPVNEEMLYFDED